MPLHPTISSSRVEGTAVYKLAGVCWPARRSSSSHCRP